MNIFVCLNRNKLKVRYDTVQTGKKALWQSEKIEEALMWVVQYKLTSVKAQVLKILPVVFL